MARIFEKSTQLDTMYDRLADLKNGEVSPGLKAKVGEFLVKITESARVDEALARCLRHERYADVEQFMDWPIVWAYWSWASALYELVRLEQITRNAKEDL